MSIILIPRQHSLQEFSIVAELEEAFHNYDNISIIVCDPNTLNNYDMKSLISHANGIIIPGENADIHPKAYGGICEGREDDLKLIQKELLFAMKALKSTKPVLGICRGFQMMNVIYGGKLTTHIDNHGGNIEDGNLVYSGSNHKVSILENSLMHSIIGNDSILTNSFHHQCVLPEQVGLYAKATAISEDGIVEAIEDRLDSSVFRLGVQWHPEKDINDENNKKILDAFINAVEENYRSQIIW